MTWYSLDVDDDTTYLDTLQQIDQDSLITGTGNPNTNSTVPAKAGVWYVDTSALPGQQLWYATASGTGNWYQILPGFQLATVAETQSGTITNKTVTPYGAAQTYATLGVNADITQLTGITTPLSVTQGGTGINTLPSLNAVLQGTGSGHYTSAALSFAQLVGLCSLQQGGTGLSLSNPETGGLLIGTGTGFTINRLTSSNNTLTITNSTGSIDLGIGTLQVAHGGTGLTTTPANGEVLIGNGTNFTLSTLTAGEGITIDNESGVITITANGEVEAEINLENQVYNFLGITNGGTGLDTTPTDGQLLIGDTDSSSYVLSTLTAGQGLVITNTGGTITLALTNEVIPIGSNSDLGIAENSTNGLLEINNGTGGVFGALTNGGLLLQTCPSYTGDTVNNPMDGSFLDGGLTATVVGTTGTTVWQYQVLPCDETGLFYDIGGLVNVVTGAATLTDANYIHLSWTAIPNASKYLIYRTDTDGSSPFTTGLIGSTTDTTFDDTGLTGDETFAPTESTYGALLWAVDGGGDIGAADSNRPFNAFISNNLNVQGVAAVNTLKTVGAVSTIYGGTGLLIGTEGSPIANGQLLIGNSTGATFGNFELTTLTAGSEKIALTNSPGSITLDVTESQLALSAIGGSLGLTSQVTGVLPVANGGTGTALFSSGTSTFVNAGSITVSDTSITADSIVVVTQAGNGSVLDETFDVEITASTGFTVYSSNSSSTALINWIRVK